MTDNAAGLRGTVARLEQLDDRGRPVPPKMSIQPQVKDHAPKFFRDDLARLNKILEPHIITLDDLAQGNEGWQGINPATAPFDAVRLYSKLISCGYARGWL